MNFSYKLFSISDLRDWLIKNKNNGLTDEIISRPRALAFINNPHSKSDDAAIAVVFDENGKTVGYTGVYAEEWAKPTLNIRYFWGSTQWMNPEFRGKGVSWKMMRQIKDAVSDKYIALDSSAASCRLDEKQGYSILYYPRYFFVLGNEQSSLKSHLKHIYIYT